MNTGTRFFSIALVFVLCIGVLMPAAYADSRRGVRSVRGISAGRSIGRGLSSMRPNGRGLQGLGGLLNSGRRQSSSRSSGHGLESLGNLLDLGRRGYGDRHGYGGGYGYGGRERYGRYGDLFGNRYDDRYRSDRAYADAMRDAAIANAIVGVVGIIADAATSPYAAGSPYAVPQQRYVAPAPQQYAPRQAVPQYRVERVLVQEGRYEEYETWVPDAYDARTGEVVKGHSVLRQRYIPEIWEERHVQVR